MNRADPAAVGAAVAGAAVIEAEGLVVSLGGRDILRGVSFTLAAGRTLAVLGPNGAGKTTLLKTLATLLTPAGGELRVFGADPRRQAAAIRRRVGYVGHQTFLYPQLDAWDNLLFWARAYELTHPERRVEEMLTLVGLDSYAREPVRQYSRGMQQRLTLARALLHEPGLLLLDEPHTGLDRQAAALLDRVVQRQRAGGGAAVLTSHDAGRAIALSDEVLVLDRGRVALQSPSAAITMEKIEALAAGGRTGDGDGGGQGGRRP